jgi:hypothetical protein
MAGVRLFFIASKVGGACLALAWQAPAFAALVVACLLLLLVLKRIR